MEEMEKLHTLRHSCSHIMAQAVQKLYPQAKLAIGPAIENGFYYILFFSCIIFYTMLKSKQTKIG